MFFNACSTPQLTELRAGALSATSPIDRSPAAGVQGASTAAPSDTVVVRPREFRSEWSFGHHAGGSMIQAWVSELIDGRDSDDGGLCGFEGWIGMHNLNVS